MEDRVLRGPKNSYKETEMAVKFAEESVASWGGGKSRFQVIIDAVKEYLDRKDVQSFNLGDWALLVINGDSRTMADKEELASSAKKQLSKQMVKDMEKKELSILAVIQDGRPTTLYRPGRVVITLLGTSNSRSWARGTRVVHMNKQGEVLCMEDIAA